MTKWPAGATTISGQAAHSLNVSSGFTARSSCPNSGFADLRLTNTGCGAGEQAPSRSACIKANPGKYSYASPGTGTPGHLVGETFRLSLGLDLVHVPFNSAGLAVGSA